MPTQTRVAVHHLYRSNVRSHAAALYTPGNGPGLHCHRWPIWAHGRSQSRLVTARNRILHEQNEAAIQYVRDDQLHPLPRRSTIRAVLLTRKGDCMSVWVIRAGASGENEDWNLATGRAGVGFPEVGDLTDCATRDVIRALLDAAYPAAPKGRKAIFTGQLWALRNTIHNGDLIIMPLKRSGQLVLGTCTSGYNYDADEPDKERRHHIKVDWSQEHISRAVLKDDLVNTLNSALTLFSPSRNHAEQRLRAIKDTGRDPRTARISAPPPTPTSPAASAGEPVADAEILDPVPWPTVEALRDRIRSHIVENFTGHKLTDLVAEIL